MSSSKQRKESSNELAEARLRERIKFFITDVIKSPDDIIVRTLSQLFYSWFI